MLSKVEESEPNSETIGLRSEISPNKSVLKYLALADAQFLFPWIVLISPLWAR